METVMIQDAIDKFGDTIPQRCRGCEHALALYAIKGMLGASSRQQPDERITENEMEQLVKISLQRCSDEFGCS